MKMTAIRPGVWGRAQASLSAAYTAKLSGWSRCRVDGDRRIPSYDRRRGGHYVPMDLYVDLPTVRARFHFAPGHLGPERRRDGRGRRFMV
jgi:hypothetical protein